MGTPENHKDLPSKSLSEQPIDQSQSKKSESSEPDESPNP